MSGVAEDKRSWIKSVLGVELAGGSQGDAPQAKGPAQGGTDDGEDAPNARLPGFLGTIQDGVTSGVKAIGEVASTVSHAVGIDQVAYALGASASSGMAKDSDKDVLAALKGLADGIADLKKAGFDTKQLEARHKELSDYEVAATKFDTDDKRFKAFDKIKKQAGEALDQSKELLKQLKAVMGESKDPPTDEQKAAVYKKSIEDLYKISIEVAPGMTNTHFDKMFDMFASVPKDHVKQDSLKKLLYSKTGGGLYYSSSGKIEMGDFGAADGEEDYEIGGKTVKANSHDVTALHEVGHAVDQEHGLMSSNKDKAGCGGWKDENASSVTTTFVAHLKTNGGFSETVTQEMLTNAVNAALTSGDTTQPDGFPDDDWQKIIGFLVDKCLRQRPGQSPWFKDAIVVGDRGYTQSSTKQWYSYLASSRTSTLVNKYQWRSPPEWFAEVYAITWLKKKKPPSAVDSSVAKYMWQEGS